MPTSALLLLLLSCCTSAEASSSTPWTRLFKKVAQSPTASGVGFAAGLVVGSTLLNPSTFEVYYTASDVPSAYIREHKSLSADVISVADGDTIRVRHRPLPLVAGGPQKIKGKLKDETISVRLMSVDAPEVGKFGRPSQPFADVARGFVKESVLGKRIRVRCWDRDQYGRLVGEVRYGPFGRKELSPELVREGLAVVYTGKDASYGERSVGEWKALQTRAQAERRGMWVDGVEGVQLPSEYKRAARQAKSTPSTAAR